MLATQATNRSGLVLDSDVGGTHRHANVGESSKLASLRKRRSMAKQFGNVGAATGSVEVCNALFGLVRNPDTLKVEFHHFPSSAFFQPRKEGKEGFVILKPVHPEPEFLDKFRMKRKYVSPAVFGTVTLPQSRSLGLHRA